MKRVIILTVIFYSTFINLKAQTDQIKWLSFEEAVKLNKSVSKKFFIDFYTDWCGWCKRLDAVTFQDPGVVKLINNNFYAIKFDAERKDTVRFQNRDYVYVKPPESNRGYHVLAAALMNKSLSYPTMVIMSVDGISEDVTFLNPIQGYLDGSALQPYLAYFAQNLHTKQVNFEEFKLTYVVNK